jgi:hypothetical protein
VRSPRYAARRTIAVRSWTHVRLASASRYENADEQYCTTRLENTHGTEIRELLYPRHPWSGLRISVHEAIDRPDGVVFRCDLDASDANRRLEIPAWMFDRSACARVRVATDAHVDLSALIALAALLRDVLKDGFAASNAPDSGVSNLSRDQNRGETDATAEQPQTSTPRRAAANRPVRRRTADERQRARLVRATDGDTGSTNRPDDAVDAGLFRQKTDWLDDGGRS